MSVLLLTVVVIGVVMLLMAVGVLFGHGCLTGSCGGLELLGSQTRSLRCSWCPYRSSDGTPGDQAANHSGSGLPGP